MKWLIGIICVTPMMMTGNENSVSWWVGTLLMTTVGLLIWEDSNEN